jgi:hypothetical protein
MDFIVDVSAKCDKMDMSGKINNRCFFWDFAIDIYRKNG